MKTLAYASNDATLLLQVWYKLLPRVDLSLFQFERSRKYTLKLYKVPKSSEVKKVFHLVIDRLPASNREYFRIEEQHLLFERVFNWRMSTCKEIDNSTGNFLPDSKLGLIVRGRPLNSRFLINSFPKAKLWSEDVQKPLLILIENHVKTYTMSKPILTNEPNETWETSDETVLRKLGASPTMDIAPMDIQIVVPNDLCNMQLSVISSDKGEQRSGKNNRNHKRKRSWLNNCKKLNESLIAQGLPPIPFFRNTGVKRRVRDKVSSGRVVK
jgi:hypothetical protein